MKKNGFTLIELVVAMTIVAILANMVAPLYRGITTNRNLDASANSLLSALLEARSRAILQRKIVQVNLNSIGSSTESITYWMPHGDATLTKATATTLYFGPNGFAQKSSTDTDPLGTLTFMLCDNKANSAQYSRKLTMSYLGFIQDSGVVGGCSSA